MMKKVLSILKGQRICDKCRKTIASSLPQSFGNEAVVSSSSEYDINKKEDLDSFKTKQTHFVALQMALDLCVSYICLSSFKSCVKFYLFLKTPDITC
jgi:hypothetical protein